MKWKKIFRYVVLPLLLILCAAAIYIYKEYHRTHKDTARLKPDYTVSAGDLLKEFAGNEQGSNKKYWDKVIVVNGILKELGKDDRGLYTVALGDTASMSSVRCNIDSLHSAEAALLQEGAQVSVKGICSGYNSDELLGSDVILVRSVVNKN